MSTKHAQAGAGEIARHSREWRDPGPAFDKPTTDSASAAIVLAHDHPVGGRHLRMLLEEPDSSTDLTAAETDRLVELEQTVDRGLQTFVEVGQALAEIRDRKLYRASHDTFERYCRERWGFTRQRALQFIDAAAVTTFVVKAGLPASSNEALIGRGYPSTRLGARIAVERQPAPLGLSDRELEVLRLVAQGRPVLASRTGRVRPRARPHHGVATRQPSSNLIAAVQGQILPALEAPSSHRATSVRITPTIGELRGRSANLREHHDYRDRARPTHAHAAEARARWIQAMNEDSIATRMESLVAEEREPPPR